MAAWHSAMVVRAAACGLALLAVVIAGIVTADAINFIGRPWAGFGMLPDGSVAPLALSPLRIGAEGRGLAFDDRIVAVDGAPVDGAAGVRAVVARVGRERPCATPCGGGDDATWTSSSPRPTFTGGRLARAVPPAPGWAGWRWGSPSASCRCSPVRTSPPRASSSSSTSASR